MTGCCSTRHHEGRSSRGKAHQEYTSGTIIHQDLVPENKIKDGEAVAICCAHGDTVLYPLAQVCNMEVEGRQIEIEAAVSNTLPMSVLLGTHTEEVAELLVVGEKKAEGDAFVFSTRAVTRKQQTLKGESACEVLPNPRGENIHQEDDAWEKWMSKLDDELFVKGKQKRKQTRSEGDKKMKEHHELDMTAKEMKNLQIAEPSLQDVRRMAEKQESKAGVGFFLKDGCYIADGYLVVGRQKKVPWNSWYYHRSAEVQL